MKKVFTLALTLLLTAGTLFAANEDVKKEVRELLEARDKQIKELLGPKGSEYTDEQRVELKDIINDVIDYRAMAQYALQDTWDEISEEQRNEFVDIFAQVVRDQSLNSLDIYRAEVTYDGFEVNGKEVKAMTTATLENVRTPVIYQLAKSDGEWVVTDMSIDNVSTAASYRRSFQNIIRRRGFDALMDNLKRRAGA